MSEPAAISDQGERMRVALLVEPTDDMAVALRDLEPGVDVAVGDHRVRLAEPVRAKHKFAVRDLERGELVKLLGVVVGRMTRDVPCGGAITTENLEHASAPYTADRGAYEWTAPDVSPWRDATFDGYHRPDGSVGTANHWLFVPLVFCENRNLETIRQALCKTLGYDRRGPYEDLAERLATAYRSGEDAAALEAIDPGAPGGAAGRRLFERVDSIGFLTHHLGCGGTRVDARNLCGLLAGYINHPNVAGATVLSLGCENAQVSILREELTRRNPDLRKPLLVYEQQKCASEQDMLARAIRETFIALAEVNEQHRRPAPLSKLTVGMECGGSDGFSGISANPTLGRVADLVVALGGRVILAEFPELCGVEQELINRCVSDEVAERFAGLMRTYERHAEAVGAAFDQNPSPGNIRDGLITDAIKSAGAAKKGGTSPVVDAIDYPGWVTRDGLSLLCTPGGDIESTTALAGAGANVMLFSTGMGTPTGNIVTPVIKVSTNSDVAARLGDLIDFDAGPVIDGRATIDGLGEELLAMVVAVASGRAVPKAVANGHDEFIPWKRGVSL